MEIRFDDPELEAYANGQKCRLSRKLDPNLHPRFERMLQAIRVAERIDDLWKVPAYNIERIRGTDREWSLRLNIKWRVHAEIVEEPVDGTGVPQSVVILLRISPHDY